MSRGDYFLCVLGDGAIKKKSIEEQNNENKNKKKTQRIALN